MLFLIARGLIAARMADLMAEAERCSPISTFVDEESDKGDLKIEFRANTCCTISLS